LDGWVRSRFHFHRTKPIFSNTGSHYCLPNLRTLSLFLGIESSTVLHLTQLLSNLAAPNLQQIYLYLGSPSFSLEIMDSRPWKEIDRILSSQAFSSLHSVKILSETKFYVPVKIPAQHQEIFPSLTSRGILKVWIEERI
jgi:hypothetical protein